jgi:hypothetical protein
MLENPDISWADSDESFRRSDDECQDKHDQSGKEEKARGEGTVSVGGSTIPLICLQDIRFEGVLGYGRNGCVIWATWNRRPVAVKQFDCARDVVYHRFVNEIRAYETLREVQGQCVPRAYFVSELPGFDIKYLGLQLGRDPSPNDTKFDRWDVYRIRCDEYGIKHNDFVGRNGGVVIADRYGNERLVRIDWEDYEISHPVADCHMNNTSTCLSMSA